MINYYLITKPGIILGNLFTVAAGFLLASRGELHFALFLATLGGLGLIMASACVFNNYIDRPMDKKMDRTKNRALVTGAISPQNALVFAGILGLAGFATLFYFTNLIALSAAILGFIVYVVLYSGWKSKTIYGTAIGSIAGAIPPVVGYTAVSNQVDLGAVLLFALLVLWQMPHFFSIALYRLRDYQKAGVPVLPLEKGVEQTKIHMALYIVAFMIAATLLTHYGYLGYVYLSVALIGGLAWLILSLAGFRRKDNEVWGKQMFRLSLVVITAICLVIPFDTL